MTRRSSGLTLTCAMTAFLLEPPLNPGLEAQVRRAFDNLSAVLGAAGGAGLAAVEIGALLGARVIACASSPEKLALAHAHGAGEGIDYGLETGHLAAQVITSRGPSYDLSTIWPGLLRERYGEAFSIARRLAGLITVPGLLPTLGPVGMRSQILMTFALRVMGNLVTPEDRDFTARLWRTAGRASVRLDDRPPFS